MPEPKPSARTPSRNKLKPQHIDMRPQEDGSFRPRFAPGPRLRRLGFTSYDLKHSDGSWFTFEQCRDFSKQIEAEATQREGRTPTPSSPSTPAPTRAFAHLATGKTLSQCAEALFQRPEFQGKPVIDGKKHRPGLALPTVRGYIKSARAAEQAGARMEAAGKPHVWHAPVAAITPKVMNALLHEVETHSGLHQVRAVRAFLSTLWSREVKAQPGVIKSLFAELDPMPVPPGRIHPWEPQQFWAMVMAAEQLGRPELADQFFVGVLHGLRQTDRLDPTVVSETPHHITIKPSKSRNRSGLTITLKKDAWLKARLSAAAKRREAHKVHWPQMMIDEQASSPWHPDGHHYRKVFGQVRAHAAKSMPSCADIRDQDLRDTNQTWLDRLTVDPRTMGQLAGHSLGEKTAIQKRHYVAINQQRMDAAVEALSQYLTDHAPEAAKEQLA